MADTTFYKYLKAAFSYKVYDSKGKTATPDTSFSSFGYNLTYKKIFEYARELLPVFYSNPAEFPDTEEGNLQLAKKVLEKLDNHQDIELENKFNRMAVSAEEELIIAEAQAESQQAVAGQTASGGTTTDTSAGSMPFGMPAGPSMPSPLPRQVFVVPPKGGKEGGTGEGTAATRKINKANKAGVTTQPVRRIRSYLGNAAKKIGSKAGIFARRNLGRAARGIIGPGLTGAANFLGRAGLRGANFGASFLSQLSTGTSSLTASAGSKKLALRLLGAFFLFFIIVGIIGGLPGTTPTGEASPIGTGCPDTSTNRNDAACHYLNPSIDIFDTRMSGESYIQKYKDSFIGKQLNDGSTGTEDEFKRRVSAIITKAQSAGINPALVLGFWKSESAFSTMGRAGNDLGCRPDNPEITTFDEDLLCAVGLKSEGKTYEPSITVRCATSKDANSSSCLLLKGIRSNPISDKSFDGTQPLDTTNPIKYPLATFDDFMEAYGPYRHLNDQRLHTNCTHTYNTILEVSKEVGMCKTTSNPIAGGGGAPTICSGTPVSFSNVDKKFLPLPTESAACAKSVTGACGRPGTCVQNPTRIVLHTTGGGASAIDVYNYFANSPDGRGVGSHFIIGKDGTTIQAVEMLEGKVEVAYAVADYSDHISIEIVHSSIYKDKDEVPAAQYQAIINLVKQLMKTYNIPNGKLDYEWFSTEKGQNPAAIPGLYGHYQLNPATLYGKEGRADPGIGLQRDVKNELK